MRPKRFRVRLVGVLLTKRWEGGGWWARLDFESAHGELTVEQGIEEDDPILRMMGREFAIEIRPVEEGP